MRTLTRQLIIINRIGTCDETEREKGERANNLNNHLFIIYIKGLVGVYIGEREIYKMHFCEF